MQRPPERKKQPGRPRKKRSNREDRPSEKETGKAAWEKKKEGEGEGEDDDDCDGDEEEEGQKDSKDKKEKAIGQEEAQVQEEVQGA